MTTSLLISPFHNAIALHPLYRSRRRQLSTEIMGSKSRISKPGASTGMLRRKSSNSIRKPEDIAGGASFSDKLEALKNLIPSESAEIKPEELFQETADYIVLLKTQVFILQKLIDLYGSQPQDN